MAAIKIRILGLGLLIAASTSASCNHVGDQYCEVGADLNNPTENCPFGPPGGPGVKSDGACPAIVVNTGAECAGVTWAGTNGIWNTQLRASCSGQGVCHDDGKGNGSVGIYLPVDDAVASFQRLKMYQPAGFLHPYVSDTDTAHAWILCNLKGVPNFGSKMPATSNKLVPLSEASFAAVETWAKCGEIVGTNGPAGPPDAGAGDAGIGDGGDGG